MQCLKDGVRFRQCDGRSGIVCTGRSGFHRAKRYAQVQFMLCCIRKHLGSPRCLWILRLTATWHNFGITWHNLAAVSCHFSSFLGLHGLDLKVASPLVPSHSAELTRQEKQQVFLSPTKACCRHIVTGC